MVAKLFLENSLKNVVFNYFNEINNSFSIINIKILNNKIDLKFSKEDFIKAKNNLNQKLNKNKGIFDKLIDSKFQLMEKEYDKVINNFNNGNFKSYEKSIEDVAEKINKIKEDLQSKINEEFKHFTEEIMKELNFIVELLKELKIKEEKNANDIDMFQSVNETEKTVFGGAGVVLVSPIVLTVYLLCRQNPFGWFLLAGGIYGATFLTTTMIATTGGIGAGVAGLVHLGFSLYKKYTEKDKYIELIENAKKELKNSCSEIKTEVNKNLETNKNQIESAVKNFEEIFFSKSEGLINHKEEWLTIFNKFKKLALNLKLMN